MQHLFLTSSIEIDGVGESIQRKIGNDLSLRTAFVMTPVEGEKNQDDLSWVSGERNNLNANNFSTFDYTITGKNIETITRDLQGIDVLYVTGGNEFYFKDQANQTGFSKYLTDYVTSGKPYISSSAGSIAVAQDMSALLNLSDTTSLSQPVDTTGFGFVNFTILPHWGSQDFRSDWLGDKSFEYMYKSSTTHVALNNFEYIEVVGDQFRIIDVRREK